MTRKTINKILEIIDVIFSSRVCWIFENLGVHNMSCIEFKRRDYKWEKNIERKKKKNREIPAGPFSSSAGPTQLLSPLSPWRSLSFTYVAYVWGPLSRIVISNQRGGLLYSKTDSVTNSSESRGLRLSSARGLWFTCGASFAAGSPETWGHVHKSVFSLCNEHESLPRNFRARQAGLLRLERVAGCQNRV